MAIYDEGIIKVLFRNRNLSYRILFISDMLEPTSKIEGTSTYSNFAFNANFFEAFTQLYYSKEMQF